MGFMPKGVVVGDISTMEQQTRLPKQKMKQEFSIMYVNTIKKEDGSFEFIAKPKSQKSFSIPTEEGVFSFDQAKVTGISKIFCEGNFKSKDQLKAYGLWKEENGEVIFKCDIIYEEMMDNIEALRKFLEGRRLPRIGEINANKIIEKWGSKTFDILDFETEKLVEIQGITQDHIPAIKEKWAEIRNVYEIIAILGEHNVSEDIARKAYKYYKEMHEFNGKTTNIIDLIKENPYELMSIKGIGFKKADEIAKSFNFSMNSKKRIKACLHFCLEELVHGTGNTAIPAKEWIFKFKQETEFDLEKSQKCCQWLINEREVEFKKVNIFDEYGVPHPIDCVISQNISNVEKSIAKNLFRIFSHGKKIEEHELIDIEKELSSPDIKADETQKVAIKNAILNSVSILTGGPGTGKTTTCKNIVHIFADKLRRSIYLAAPTGKAAQRMGEQIGQGIDSQTIHRMLGAKNYFFEYNEYNQMAVGVYIIDESSMLDIFIADALLKAIPNGSTLIFVGDKDQLQSVGAGDVLRDILKSEVFNISTLKKPHRYENGADIGVNAALINEGKLPDLTGTFEKNSNFIFIRKQEDGEILSEILNVVNKLNKEMDVPFSDIQVLSPQKNKLVGVDTLNMNLRPIFNPFYSEMESMNPKPKFYNGDRVMHIENDYEKELFNGDVGYVSKYDIEDESFDFNEIISGRSVSMDKSNMYNIVMAYAMTVHKSQGSESPYIIIPLSANHSYTLNRNNIYTGVTRAKKMVILIGDIPTLRSGIKKVKQKLRVTTLVDELHNCFNQ